MYKLNGFIGIITALVGIGSGAAARHVNPMQSTPNFDSNNSFLAHSKIGTIWWLSHDEEADVDLINLDMLVTEFSFDVATPHSTNDLITT